MITEKTLCVNPFYIIKPDGSIFSIRRKKFLKPTPHKGGGQVTIRNFQNGKNEKFLINRLKFFHFEKHFYANFEQMAYVKINKTLTN